tara:strand:+ start:168 stop:569 length:402 start_codon:yes stop_codon:yes gene_type:complete
MGRTSRTCLSSGRFSAFSPFVEGLSAPFSGTSGSGLTTARQLWNASLTAPLIWCPSFVCAPRAQHGRPRQSSEEDLSAGRISPKNKKPDLADFPRSRRDIQRMQVSTEIDYQIYTSTNALFEIENFNSEICPE